HRQSFWSGHWLPRSAAVTSPGALPYEFPCTARECGEQACHFAIESSSPGQGHIHTALSQERLVRRRTGIHISDVKTAMRSRSSFATLNIFRESHSQSSIQGI